MKGKRVMNVVRRVMALAGLAGMLLCVTPRSGLAATWTDRPFFTSNEIGPKPSPDGKHVVYISDVSGSPQVFIANADGAGAWQVTNDAQGASDPAWSPDGRYVVYGQAQPIGQPRDTFKAKLTADLSAVESTWNITNGAGSFAAQHFRFSPDGQTIAGGLSNGGFVRLGVLPNLDGEAHYPGDWTQVGQSAQSNHPAWKPDGSLFAYAKAGSAWTNSEIRTIKPDGSEDIGRFDAQQHVWSLAWSPDGQYLAFSNQYDPNGYVGIAEVDWTKSDWDVTVLDTSAGFCHQVYSGQADIWSPDGDSIVYSRFEDEHWNTYTIDFDGTNKTLVTASAGDDYYARFSADGTIIFQTNRNGNWDIYTATPEPATLSLLALGGLAVLRRRRKQ